MKKLVLCFLLVVLCGPSALLGRMRVAETSDHYEKVSLAQFSQLLYQGVSTDELRNVLVECPAGSELPFKFTLRGEIFTFEPTKDVAFSIKLIKTCYLKYEPKVGIVFSTDLHNWKKFENFFVGKAAASFTNENQIPTANFEIELNEQTHRWELPIGPNHNLYSRNRYYHHYYTYPDPMHTWTTEESNRRW